jgi:predicted RecB family nuclease
VCDARRAADDHRSLVANMRGLQRMRLAEVGITTVAQLATATPVQRPTRIGAHTFEALREQARWYCPPRAPFIPRQTTRSRSGQGRQLRS